MHSESIPDPFEFFHILLRYSLILTETHIIINVTGFSAYGIVHEEDAPISPIQGLVLIFYQPFVPEQRSILNVLLLPSNVVRKEVSWNLTTLKKHFYLSGIQSNTQWGM